MVKSRKYKTMLLPSIGLQLCWEDGAQIREKLNNRKIKTKQNKKLALVKRKEKLKNKILERKFIP